MKKVVIYFLPLLITVSSIETNSSSHFEAAFQGKCSRTNPCVQLCTELHDGTFECNCTEGYTLMLDGYNCILSNSTNIYYSNASTSETDENINPNDDDGNNEVYEPDSAPMIPNIKNYGNNSPSNSKLSKCVSFSNVSNNSMSLPTLSNAYMTDSFYIEFKPNELDGLLVLSGERKEQILEGDFILIQLKDGFVEFTFDCGSGPGTVRSRSRVRPHSWNTLNILRRKWRGWVQLNEDGYVEGKSTGLFSRITFRTPVYIGSAPLLDAPPFSGKIRQLVINNRSYLSEDLKGDGVRECCECMHGGECNDNVCSCPLGYSGDYCETPMDLQIPSFNGTSYLKYKPLSLSATFLELELYLNPLSHDGLILYSGAEDEEEELSDYISLYINQGHLEFSANLGNGVGFVRSEEKVVLNSWHRVYVSISSRLINMEVDGVSIENYIPGAFNELTLTNNWYIGGIPNSNWLSRNKIMILNGFSGCIQKVLINSIPLNLMGSAVIGVDIENCPHDCNSEPCGPNGLCIPEFSSFECLCKLGYSGTSCQVRQDDVIIPKFNGRSFLQFIKPQVIQKFSGGSLELSFSFRSSHSEGLLFLSGTTHAPLLSTNDFFKIYLKDYYLHLVFSLGSGYKLLKYPTLLTNNWHYAYIKRTEQLIEVAIDSHPVLKGYIPGKLSQFNINHGIFIGGLDVLSTFSSSSTPGFIGCIKSIVVNNYTLLFNEAIGRNIDYC